MLKTLFQADYTYIDQIIWNGLKCYLLFWLRNWILLYIYTRDRDKTKKVTFERQTVCRDPQLTSRTSLSASFLALKYSYMSVASRDCRHLPDRHQHGCGLHSHDVSVGVTAGSSVAVERLLLRLGHTVSVMYCKREPRHRYRDVFFLCWPCTALAGCI